MYRGTYTLIGSELSMFTRKLEAQLRYQGIPYRWKFKTRAEGAAIEARAGTHFIPLLQTPDGWLLNDTIAIGPLLSERFREAPVIPVSPAQRGACFVLEDFFNHWLPRHALHSRWCYPDNVAAAGVNFGRNLLLGKSIDASLDAAESAQVADFGQAMLESFGAAACDVQGAGVDQKAAIQRDLKRLSALLVAHFAEHDFLLGARACLADFALVGPYKGHFLQDPEPRSWLADCQALAPLETYVERVWQAPGAVAPWAADDALPATLEPLFAHARDRYQRFARASLEAAARGEKFFTLDLGDGPFTARSMKRLDKARLHVQDELLRAGARDTVLAASGTLEYYLAAPYIG